jgi:RNA polymerase sigma factor (sigma-70 family)
VGTVWRAVHPEEDTGSCDERLVDGLRRGTPAAFAGLHERYATGIYNLALRVVRHAPDAEDITQDVLLRAYERMPKDRDVMLRAWLYRITLNRCYDYLRISSRRPPAVAPGHEAPSPLDPYEQSELQDLLEATIGDLTRRQRAALLLKDVHGLSLVEVAHCLDLTPGSVEVLLARARRAFRARFEERCTAAGRPLPRSAGGLAALPFLPLPPGLAPPPAPFVLPPVACGPPLAVAAGGGIGAALGLPASVKTAVLIFAAAAAVGGAEVAATHGGRLHRVSQAQVAAAPAVAAHATGRTTARRVDPAGLAVSSSSPSPSPTLEASPSPSAPGLGQPDPGGTPLAIPSPTLTPSTEPSATASPGPSSTPTPSATPSPEPSPSASPSAPSSPAESPAP